MDEAFVPLRHLVERLLAFDGELTEEQAGVRSRITACEIEAPVELDVTRDEGGALRIGSVPPLYPLRTSVLPSFHRLRFTATLARADGDGRG